MYNSMPPVSYPVGSYMNMFRDYNKFIMDLQTAITNETIAAAFYTALMEIAPFEDARDFIRHARDDERKHYRMFFNLYVALTGRHPIVTQPVIQIPQFCEGVKNSIKDELEAADMYREMYLSTTNTRIRDILFEAMNDEMEHAIRFNWIYSASDCHEVD